MLCTSSIPFTLPNAIASTLKTFVFPIFMYIFFTVMFSFAAVEISWVNGSSYHLFKCHLEFSLVVPFCTCSICYSLAVFFPSILFLHSMSCRVSNATLYTSFEQFVLPFLFSLYAVRESLKINKMSWIRLKAKIS